MTIRNQSSYQPMPSVVWESVCWCSALETKQHAMGAAQRWAGDNLT